MMHEEKDATATAFGAINKVDELVSKPVLGSDGAALWQDFRKTQKRKRVSAAPMAPLKAVDRAAGSSTWSEERQNEDETRMKGGNCSLKDSGYFMFSKQSEDATAAEEPSGRDASTGHKQISAKVASEQITIKTDSALVNRGTETKKKKPARSKRKEPKKPTFVSDPSNPYEQIARLTAGSKPFPNGWEEAVDETTKSKFYFNRSTGERSWKYPSGLPPNWESVKDQKSGKVYYFNRVTNETRWSTPAC